MISVRGEISTIKTKLYGEVSSLNYIVPSNPFSSIEEFHELEYKLESEDIFKQFVSPT